MPCEGAAFQGAPDSVSACRRSGDNEIISGGAARPHRRRARPPRRKPARIATSATRFRQATWQSPVTSRLLVEAGVGTYSSKWGGVLMPGSPAGDLVQVTEQCAAGCANNGGIANLTYRSPNLPATNWQGSFNWRASAVVRRGATDHEIRLSGRLPDGQPNSVLLHEQPVLTYRTHNGVPDQLTETIDFTGPAARPLRRVLRAGGSGRWAV